MESRITRRSFLRNASAASVAAITATGVLAQDKTSSDKEIPTSRYPEVPRRNLGKTDMSVPILSLGAMYNVVDNQIGLRKTLIHNANYWDTANSYAGGNSEIGIGNYFERFPDKRAEVIIATKASGAKNSGQRDEKLKTSFERMNTDYVDIYYGVHGLSNPNQLTTELKQWSLKAKEEGKIKLFGFTTHSNMTECLTAAAECDWIDVIMTSFNFRLMQDEAFMVAVDKCHKAGIGLVAMKVMANGQDFDSEQEKALAAKFTKEGLTPAAAKIKIVLEDERIATACVGMDTITKLNENINAVIDGEKLSITDKKNIETYAKQTCDTHCIACGKCGEYSQMPYTPDIMRYVMYKNNYSGEEKYLAKSLYSSIPQSYRAKLTDFDYCLAESLCPQGIKISKVMQMASKQLA